MSLLMFDLDPDNGFWVVTDTLATGEGYRPALYQSKALFVPHLDLVVAGTGLGNLNSRWWATVLDRVLCLDIDMLALHAPEMLRAIWAQLGDELGDMPSTATIYHVGRSMADGKFVAYAFRSADDFEPESLQPGFRIKPDPPDGWEQPTSIEGIVELADATRRREDTRAPSERVHIGGGLHMITVQPHGTSFSRIHQWPDHPDMWQQMNDLLNEQNGR